MTERKKIILIGVVALVIGLLAGVFASMYFWGGDGKEKTQKAQKEKTEADIDLIEIEDYDAGACVKLGKYKGVKVSLAADETDIEIEIDSLVEEHTAYEQLKGIAQEGDLVYADFEGYVDGKKMDVTCGSDYIEIGSGDWLDGFEDAVIGLQSGQSKEFSLDVPDGTYGDKEIDGKTVDFKLTLQYICGESIVPEFNDEFVQSISKYETTEEYTEYLRKKLEKENEEDKLEYAWYEVYENSKVKEYPETLLKAASQEVLQGYYDMADIYGISHDEIFQSFGCEDEEEFIDTQLDDLAKDTAKEALVAEAIAEKENISYTTEDYEELLQDQYENNSDLYDSKEEYEKKNKYYLERTALMDVVKEWIGEHAKFTK